VLASPLKASLHKPDGNGLAVELLHAYLVKRKRQNNVFATHL
jgi:hypothetical protein